VLQHYQSCAQTRRVCDLAAAVPGPRAELHPLLAARLGVTEGQRVRLTTGRGSITVPARVSDAIRPDTVFVPFHWGGEESINRLTSDSTDPVSGMPEFKVCAVDVSVADDTPFEGAATSTGGTAPESTLVDAGLADAVVGATP
jgi:assimilatory nitrate reductase catalytic subunit